MLQPLLAVPRSRPAVFEPLDPEETPKGVALTALKEIEFDRETGKLSDADYEFLKAKYTSQALEALRAEKASGEVGDVEAMIAARVQSLRSAATLTPPTLSPDIARSCPSCGPRPETDAVFCSTCGARLPWPVPAPVVARRSGRTAAFASGAELGWQPDTDKMALSPQPIVNLLTVRN